MTVVLLFNNNFGALKYDTWCYRTDNIHLYSLGFK